MKDRVTKKEIDKASNVNIIDFLLNIGEPINKASSNSKYWRSTVHDSLVIDSSKNNFTWNSHNITGNLITYLELLHGMKFVKAVEYINSYGNIKHVVNRKNIISYPTKFDVKGLGTVKNKDTIIYNYLCNKRSISKDLIKLLINNNYIKIDQNNNIVFLWRYEKHVVGADKQGTYRTKKTLKNGKHYLKMIMPTTEKFTLYGFNLQINGSLPENLIFFESPVDLLSYLSIHKGKLMNCWLISMNGLKLNTIANCINIANKKLFPNNLKIKNVKLAVDNDEAGNNFYKKMDNWNVQSNGSIINFENEIPLKNSSLSKKVDWNSYLNSIKNKNN